MVGQEPGGASHLNVQNVGLDDVLRVADGLYEEHTEVGGSALLQNGLSAAPGRIGGVEHGDLPALLRQVVDDVIHGQAGALLAQAGRLCVARIEEVVASLRGLLPPVIADIENLRKFSGLDSVNIYPIMSHNPITAYP